MRDEIERFVASLAIPEERKAIVLAELLDHVACATEAAVREGRDPEEAARAVIGDREALRRSLEAVEPAFRITRRRAMGHGLVAGTLVAIVIDRIGAWQAGIPAVLAALALVAVLAPPHVLELLRAELRAPRVAGTLGMPSGVPIGAATTYAFTVMCTPVLVWIGLIVYRARAGVLSVDVPWSAFSVMAAVYLVLLVERIRARRTAVA